ncbi:hypothetical protein GCM10022268_17080 [Sphingomonas cynarae]|uniref:Uncharacterized protein n=1 Tax=Sphingomonas cynarae TaxID=930197 RepID=A0ABP7DSL3_9SPHN
MSADPKALRQGRRLLLIHIVATTVAGCALGLTAVDRINLALGAVFVVLIAVIASLETLRVLVFSNREPRR